MRQTFIINYIIIINYYNYIIIFLINKNRQIFWSSSVSAAASLDWIFRYE